MPPPPRPRTPADARRRAGTPPAPPQPPPRRAGLDLYHLLSAVVGAFVGLVAYSAVTPGHLPDEPAVERRDARMDLFMREVKASRDAEGYYRVTGQVFNSRGEPCKRATVGVSFRDGAREITKQLALVEDVPPHGSRPFEVKAFAPAAKAFDTTVELAHY